MALAGWLAGEREREYRSFNGEKRGRKVYAFASTVWFQLLLSS